MGALLPGGWLAFVFEVMRLADLILTRLWHSLPHEMVELLCRIAFIVAIVSAVAFCVWFVRAVFSHHHPLARMCEHGVDVSAGAIALAFEPPIAMWCRGMPLAHLMGTKQSETWIIVVVLLSLTTFAAANFALMRALKRTYPPTEITTFERYTVPAVLAASYIALSVAAALVVLGVQH